MISTGATIEAAAQVVLAHGGTCSIVAATHGLLAGEAAGRLRRLPVRRVVTTDTVRQDHSPSLGIHVPRRTNSWRPGTFAPDNRLW